MSAVAEPTRDHAAFRSAMASVCTPVAVVAAVDGSRAHGTTVSAVMSLSMDPPMVAVALDNGSELLSIVRESGTFSVNFLSAEQGSVAMVCAGKGHDKFDGLDWSLDHGLPRIARASSWIACEDATFAQGGDHVVVMGEVRAVDQEAVAPLTYHRREFGTHTSAGNTVGSDVR